MNNTNNRKTIVFFAMALSQPRCIKRVTSLRDYGFNCVVYGYDRGKYDINDYPQDVTVSHLGVLKDNEYVYKVSKVFWDIIKICKQHRNNKPVFYAFGIFQAMYLKLLGKPYIYEISDILYAYPKFKRLIGLFKAIDKSLIRGSLATVMTSGGFYSFFSLELPNIFVIPNKVSPTLKRPILKMKLEDTESLSFGFVGSMRYQTIIDFAEIIGHDFPQHKFHFWGGLKEGPMKVSIDKLTNSYDNVFYHGAFRNPEDLTKVYETFDITVSCYQVSTLNEKIAEPNKLYESIFFSKPIVVSEGIYLSQRVEEMSCGYCIDANNKESIHDFIESLRYRTVMQLSKHISKIETSLVVNDQSILNDFINTSFENIP